MTGCINDESWHSHSHSQLCFPYMVKEVHISNIVLYTRMLQLEDQPADRYMWLCGNVMYNSAFYLNTIIISEQY